MCVNFSMPSHCTQHYTKPSSKVAVLSQQKTTLLCILKIVGDVLITIMASTRAVLLIFFLSFSTIVNMGGSAATQIEAENSCDEPIWLAFVSAPESPELPADDTGFVLLPGKSAAVSVPAGWSGFAWARTRCALYPTGAFLCLTGDCGSRVIPCPRRTPVPPPAATVAYFVAVDGEYEFSVSAAAGFNVAAEVDPMGGTGARCVPTGRVGLDLKACPVELRVLDRDGVVVGCKSGEPFESRDGDDESVVSPTFACISASYLVQFCAVASQPSHDVNKPYNPEESEKGNSGNNLLAWIIWFGSLGGVGTLTTLLWWVIKKFCTPPRQPNHIIQVTSRRSNGSTTLDLTVSTSQRANNDGPGDVQLVEIVDQYCAS